LTVLIGPHNESGATMLLAELRDEREVTFIGRPTGGSAEGPTAGVIAFLELPASKITVRVPLIWNTTSYEDFESGRGIEPDILVPLTVEDLRAGRDAALVRATTPDKP
jgi:C-terminal processing protease CtpA/Prc